jgi:hypothetical protein
MGYEENALHNVRRKIAEVVKKEGEKIVVGYSGAAPVKHEEGDIWEDADGKKWTVKNGVTQSISKLDFARTPLFCPVCEKSMGHWLDTKFWRLRGKCHDCVLKEETQMRLEGKWEQYERINELRNQVAYLQEKIAELISYRDALSEPEIIHADDEKILMIEKWTVPLDKIRDDMNKDLEYMELVLANTLKDLEEAESHGN